MQRLELSATLACIVIYSNPGTYLCWLGSPGPRTRVRVVNAAEVLRESSVRVVNNREALQKCSERAIAPSLTTIDVCMPGLLVAVHLPRLA